MRRNLTPYARAELALRVRELIAAQAKERQREGGRRKVCQNSDKADTKRELAAISGVSHDTVARVAYLAERADEKTKEVLRRGETTINAEYQALRRAEREARREARREASRCKAQDAPDPLASGARFATIVIDPPWDWSDEGDVNQLGRAKPDYTTMPLAELERLPVGQLADRDCHLYLWITNRSLPKGFGLITAWGFRHVTMLTWPKPSFGMGNYFRGQTEHVLFAVKGSQALLRKDVGTLLPSWPRGGRGHSSKPDEFWGLVETCSPGPFLELFARQKRPGWATWGADVAAARPKSREK